jgi:hypothetical protein
MIQTVAGVCCTYLDQLEPFVMTDFSLVFSSTGNLVHVAMSMLAVVAAYAVFTLVGFGSALMASGRWLW